MSTYATDGKCHNSNPGTFSHECVKCRATGSEARQCVAWEPAPAQERAA